MPRKKKRSTLQRKPSLVFIESPVHVQRNVPSPVFCARHPTTAETIQVDDIHRLPWVSPQFRHGYTPGNKEGQRQNRKRRKSIACLRNINKENCSNTNNTLRRVTSTKFRSLRFFGDSSVNVSEADDVEITVDSDTLTEDEHIPNIILNKTDTLNANGLNQNKRNAGIKRSNTFKKLLKDLKSVSETSDSEGDQDLNNINKNDNENDSQVNNSGSSDLLHKSSPLEFTQIRARTDIDAPVKRLFATQLAGAASLDIDDALISVDPNKQTCCETEPETISNSDSGSGLDSPIPLRRSLRIQTLKALLLGAPSPQRNPVVLVPDTPENECGWLLRKREIFNIQRNKKLK